MEAFFELRIVYIGVRVVSMIEPQFDKLRSEAPNMCQMKMHQKFDESAEWYKKWEEECDENREEAEEEGEEE